VVTEYLSLPLVLPWSDSGDGDFLHDLLRFPRLGLVDIKEQLRCVSLPE
jgi:hypothetical protein